MHGDDVRPRSGMNVKDLIKKGAAGFFAASLVVPLVGVAAFGATGPAPTASQPTSILSQGQSVTLEAAGSAPALVRGGSYSVEYTPPAPVAPAAPAAETTAPEPGAAQTYAFAPASQTYSGENVVAYASQFIGKVPYGNGNHPDDSFSCDGYVQYVMAQFGISLPRGANGQAARGTVISASEARIGDLLWWPDQHIAFYDGAGGMLDSPDWGGFVRHRDGIWGSPLYVRL